MSAGCIPQQSEGWHDPAVLALHAPTQHQGQDRSLQMSTFTTGLPTELAIAVAAGRQRRPAALCPQSETVDAVFTIASDGWEEEAAASSPEPNTGERVGRTGLCRPLCGQQNRAGCREHMSVLRTEARPALLCTWAGALAALRWHCRLGPAYCERGPRPPPPVVSHRTTAAKSGSILPFLGQLECMGILQHLATIAHPGRFQRPCCLSPFRTRPPAAGCQLLLCPRQRLAQLATLALRGQQAALQPLHLRQVACSSQEGSRGATGCLKRPGSCS